MVAKQRKGLTKGRKQKSKAVEKEMCRIRIATRFWKHALVEIPKQLVVA